MKKNLLLSILCCLALGCSSHNRLTHKIKISSLEYKFRTEGSFKGIVEAITGKEYNSGLCVLRTDPQKREGGYFLVILNCHTNKIPKGSILRIKYVDDNEQNYRERTWEINRGFCKSEILAGATEDKKLSSKTSILAWKVTLEDKNANVLAEKQSFAWNCDNLPSDS